MPVKKYAQPLVDRACKLTGKKPDTIRRWAKKGLNLSDDLSIIAWNEEHGHSNDKKQTVSPDELKPPAAPPKRQLSAAELDILDRLPAPGDEGAAAALKRLQGLEPIFYSRLLTALASPDRPDLLGIANSEYSKVTESLRKYEAAVEMTRREMGHLMPKKEAQDGARAAALWFRLAWRLWLSSSLPDLLAIKDPRTAKAKAEESFSEILLVSFKNASEAKLSIPDWALSAITEEFHVHE